MLQIERAKAVAVLIHAGWKAAGKWNDDRICGRLPKVADAIVDASGAEDPLSHWIDMVLMECGDDKPEFQVIPDGEIEIILDEEKDKPEPPAKPEPEPEKETEDPGEPGKGSMGFRGPGEEDPTDPPSELPTPPTDEELFGIEDVPAASPEDSGGDLEAILGGRSEGQPKTGVPDDPEEDQVDPPLPKRKAKPKPDSELKERIVTKTRGMKSRKTRFYVAGKLLFDLGVPDHLTVEHVDMFNKEYGTNIKERDAMNILRSAWQVINGYRNRPTGQDKIEDPNEDDADIPPSAE